MTHKEKKQVIERLVNVPTSQKRIFWGREIKTFNILYEVYPDKKFWTNVKFFEKLDSLILFRSGYYAKELEKKYRLFNYKIPPKKNITLGQKPGKDLTLSNKPKTLKDFLS